MVTKTPTPSSTKTAKFSDFFALFDLPITFDIDRDTLDTQYRELQRQYHPDKLKTATSQDQEEAISPQSLSAIINQAYQTLRSPDSRASYLLELKDQAGSLNNSIADLTFLDDAMTLRVTLDEAIDDQNLATLQQLKPQIVSRLETQSSRFNSSYADQDWSTASDAAQKLKFLVKLNADVLAGIDSVANQSHDDNDDLYV